MHGNVSLASTCHMIYIPSFYQPLEKIGTCERKALYYWGHTKRELTKSLKNMYESLGQTYEKRFRQVKSGGTDKDGRICENRCWLQSV